MHAQTGGQADRRTKGSLWYEINDWLWYEINILFFSKEKSGLKNKDIHNASLAYIINSMPKSLILFVQIRSWPLVSFTPPNGHIA